MRKLDYITYFLSDNLYRHARYYLAHRRFGNFRNPRKFSEKIFYRMANGGDFFSLIADKYRVRSYIESTIGKEYLVPLYAVCKTLSREVYDSLPSSFVMKANHSAGQVLIVKDKADFSFQTLKEIGDTWLKVDYGNSCRERHYSKIERLIIFEKLLGDGSVPPDDFKVNFFSGGQSEDSYLFIQHMTGRGKELRQTIYTSSWDVSKFQRRGYENAEIIANAPKQLSEMKRLSKLLCGHLSYLRVDFYLQDDRIYVGELTVTPGGGNYSFIPDSADELLGQKFYWPEISPKVLSEEI